MRCFLTHAVIDNRIACAINLVDSILFSNLHNLLLKRPVLPKSVLNGFSILLSEDLPSFRIS